MNREQISRRDRARFLVATHPNLPLIVAIATVIMLMAALLMAHPVRAGAQEIPTISTDRPGQSTSPSILIPGSIQIEGGVQLAGDGPEGATTRTLGAPQLLLRLGVLPALELRLQGELRHVRMEGSGGETTERGIAGVALGTKIGITPERGAIPEMALGVTLGLPVGEDAFRAAAIAPAFYLATRSGLGTTLNLYTNIGGAWDGTSGAGSGFYTAALWNAFSEKVSGFVEIYGALASGAAPSHAADAGLSYIVHPAIQLDLSGGTGITGSATDYFINGGISLRLPL